MSRGFSRKQLKQDEFVEAAVDIGQWFEENWRRVLLWAGVAVGVALLATAGVFWVRHQRALAVETLSQGIAAYDRSAEAQFSDINELSAALDSFEQAAERAGSSPTGRLARYYGAATLFRLGRFGEAATALEEHLVGADPADTLTWAAQSMLCDAWGEADQADRAIELLEGLAAAPAGGYPPDQALVRIGRIEQRRGNSAAARKAWKRAADDYAQSAGGQEARQLLGP